MKRDPLGEFQGNAADPEGQLKEEDVERLKEERRQVLEVLDMAGYSILHKLIVGRMTEGMKRLQDVRLSEKEMRFEQGAVSALSGVQHAFVHYNEFVEKEEE